MDYEKKYNNALNRAKHVIEDCGDNQGRKNMIYGIFPELAGSDDERTRKEIIHYLDYTAGGLSAEQQHKWIAYLEKLKEQRPTINIEYLKSYMLQYLQEASNRKDDSEIEADTDRWARMITKFFGGVEQKPAEWGEEDEKMLEHITVFVSGYADKRVVKNWVAFLKSLRPQPHWKPSEEQMKIFNEAIEHYSKYWDSEDIKILCSLYDDLKKLL